MYQKSGSKALKKLDNFRDDFIFDFKDTGKLLMLYNDNQMKFNLKDYQGNNEKVIDKYGCCFVPTTYELGKSIEYADLISSESSNRAIYNERGNI